MCHLVSLATHFFCFVCAALGARCGHRRALQFGRHARPEHVRHLRGCGRVRFDLVVQIDFSFIVCPLVIILMFLIVIVQLSGS